LELANLPEKYKERMLERRRTHGTRRTTFRNFKITLPPKVKISNDINSDDEDEDEDDEQIGKILISL
ncbi:1442_t:CDS:2, partial [Funneliformis mosseae]